MDGVISSSARILRSNGQILYSTRTSSSGSDFLNSYLKYVRMVLTLIMVGLHFSS